MTFSTWARRLGLVAVAASTAAIVACSYLSISATDEAKLQGDSYTEFSATPVVGKPAPAFNLKDADGIDYSLAELTAEKPVLLLFYRGEWCPFCMDQLDGIKAVLPKLQEHGVQVVAVSPDSASALKNTRRQFGQGFLFLSDENSRVISEYGIARDDKLPHPAVYLIKAGGELAWFYASEDYKTRPTGEQLIKLVEQRL